MNVSRRLVCTVGVVIGVAMTALLSGPALAAPATDEDETVVARTATPVESTPLVPEGALRLQEGTAYMVGRHTLLLGILSFDFGILEKLSIGTDPPSWAARAISKIWIPNLHVKYQFWNQGRVAVAAQVAGYFADISKGDNSGSILEVPITGFVSVICARYLILHPDVTYIFARGFGTGDVTQATVHGVAAVRALQAGLIAQFPITKIFSLLLAGRGQLYTSNIGFSGSSQVDPYTDVTLNGTFVPAIKHPWQVVAGAAFLWKHFYLSAGAGYGYYFVPGLDLPVPKQSIVPLLSLSVVL